jgi:PAS domain S-box-containing protein
MDLDRSAWRRYAASVVAVATALVVCLAMRLWIGPFIYPPFLIAVLLCARFGGLGPGLTATVLSCVASGILLARSVGLPMTTGIGGGVQLVSYTGIEALAVYFMVARRRDLAALRESETSFRVLTEAMPQIVWSTLADGSVDYCNPRWLEFSGLLSQQALGAGWGVIVHPEDLDITMTAWQRALETGEPYRFEHRLRNRQGEYRWFLSQALPKRSEDGKILKWYGTCTDIDEQKRTQSALTAATRAKDHFLAVLSHELRTPLTPALMSVSAMLERPEISPSCRLELTLIRDNIVLEARLIDDLLDISRIARGKMLYRFEAVDLHGVIRRVVQNCSGDIELRGHSLTVELEAVEHHLDGDSARLQQMLSNLLSNAVKYTPEYGRITVRTRSDSSGRLFVEVGDNGIGIDPCDLPQIFNAFDRLNETSPSKVGGLGLGLTISRSIAESHAGSLDVASEGRNRGTWFTLELPTVPAPKVRVDAPAPPASTTNRTLRILLVEDNAPTAQATAHVFRQKGYEVSTVASLKRGLEAVSGTYDVIVSDLDLGDGSGLDLMRHARTLGNTPGIALSGYATQDDVHECLAAGFALHLAKPITISMLEKAIQKVTA